jgi:hypothetical protein
MKLDHAAVVTLIQHVHIMVRASSVIASSSATPSALAAPSLFAGQTVVAADDSPDAVPEERQKVLPRRTSVSSV